MAETSDYTIVRGAYDSHLSIASGENDSDSKSLRWAGSLYAMQKSWEKKEETQISADFFVDVVCPPDGKGGAKESLPICRLFGSGSLSVKMSFSNEGLSSQLYCEVDGHVPLTGGSTMRTLVALLEGGSLGVPIAIASAFKMCVNPLEPTKNMGIFAKK